LKKKLSVIIPFLNEEENINTLVVSLNVFFESFSEVETEVIFVDDGSSDKSVELLQQNKHTSYKSKIVKLSKNFGSLPALYAGISHANGDLITFIYADLQDPLALIKQMFHKHQEGYDIVWAERKSVQVASSRIFSKVYARLMKKYAVPNFPENGYDVVMFSDKIGKIIKGNIESNSSIFLQILSLGFNQTSILYDKVERKAGTSKWTTRKKIKLVVDSFIAFSYAPIRFVTFMGLSMALLGFLYGIFIVIYKICGGQIAYGWSGLIVILMLGFGVTNISLGIIAEYLWRTLDASRKRSVFIVDQIIPLNK